jgi:hypothetical protein
MLCCIPYNVLRSMIAHLACFRNQVAETEAAALFALPIRVSGAHSMATPLLIMIPPSPVTTAAVAAAAPTVAPTFAPAAATGRYLQRRLLDKQP